MTTYVVTAMVSFEDDAASAQHIFNQINAVMVNASVARIGEPGERTSYCSVGTENPDGTVKRTSHLYVDQFGIVRQGDPDPNDPPAHIMPTGVQDAYPANDVRGNQTRVTDNGQTWRNTHGDGNIWAPGVFGWTAE
jgi:hypothetical protein